MHNYLQQHRLYSTMERLKYIQTSLVHSDIQQLREELWRNRHRIIYAMEPRISKTARKIVKKQYREILRKIEQTRLQLARMGKVPKINTNDQNYSYPSQQFFQQFRMILENNLYEVVPGMLNELADELCFHRKQPGEIVDEGVGMLSKALSIYSSVMGSYRCRLSLMQKLTPNVRTLHYLQSQIMQLSNQRESSGSVWILLYIFSAAFVQIFGKYITKPEMAAVFLIIKEAFVLNIIMIATSDQAIQNINFSGPNYKTLPDLVDQCIKQLGTDLQ